MQSTQSFVLPTTQQLIVAFVTLLLFALGLMLGNPLLPVILVAGCTLLWVTIKTPFHSLVTLIVANVLLSLRPHDVGAGESSTLDILFGIVFVGISAYWIIRWKILERKQLTVRASQLVIGLFLVWSFVLTTVTSVLSENSIIVGMREILNLVPLFVMPLLYAEAIETDSKRERSLFAVCIGAAVIIVLSNIILFRSNVVHAVYLYETGRSALDLAATTLLTLMMSSVLMTTRRPRVAFFAAVALVLSALGIVISFTRTFYALIPVSIGLLLFLGNKEERRRGMRRLSWTVLVSAVGMAFVYFSNRLLRLLILNFTARLVTTKKVQTDLSLVNRYSEWHAIWHEIVHSPIAGYGFGRAFRYFQVISHVHNWTTFSHNSYLYIWYKTGTIGFILFMAANVAVIVKGRRVLQQTQRGTYQYIVARGLFVFILLTLFGAYTGPTFNSKIAITWLGLSWAYILAHHGQQDNRFLSVQTKD